MIVTGTLGKALGGAAGGFVAGGAALCERARAALAPPALLERAAADGRRQLARARSPSLRESPPLVARLRENTALLPRAAARGRPAPARGRERDRADHRRRDRRGDPDQPAACSTSGVYVTGFGYPVVPEGTARMRIQVSAALDPAQIETAVEAIAAVVAEAGVTSPPPAGRRP